MKLKIKNKEYELIKNENDSFNLSDVEELFTEYFDNFDYILGDISYDKLRLKGFCDKKNKIFKSYNDYNKIDDYIKNRCSKGLKYFILKKIDNK